MPTDELEIWWAKQLKGVEKYSNTTINSGAIKGDEDVITSNFICQCKRSSTKKNFIIETKDWDQLQAAAISNKNIEGNYRTGLFIVENYRSDKILAIDPMDFICLLKRINELEKIKEEYDKVKKVIERSGMYLDDIIEIDEGEE
jgi:hypothetical protein